MCSPHEVQQLRSEHPRPFVLVTPGVRPPGSAAGDQRRVATPAEALGAGSDLLVIGRPITQSPSPSVAARQIVEGLTAL